MSLKTAWVTLLQLGDIMNGSFGLLTAFPSGAVSVSCSCIVSPTRLSMPSSMHFLQDRTSLVEMGGIRPASATSLELYLDTQSSLQQAAGKMQMPTPWRMPGQEGTVWKPKSECLISSLGNAQGAHRQDAELIMRQGFLYRRSLFDYKMVERRGSYYLSYIVEVRLCLESKSCMNHIFMLAQLA